MFYPSIIPYWPTSSVENRQDTVSMWSMSSSNHRGALFVLAGGAAEFSADCRIAAIFNSLTHTPLCESVPLFPQQKTKNTSEIHNFTLSVVQSFMCTFLLSSLGITVCFRVKKWSYTLLTIFTFTDKHYSSYLHHIWSNNVHKVL